MNKKVISIILAMVMILTGSTFTAFAGESQSTVSIDLEKKIHEGYINGYDDGTIRPENNITRAEVASIFYRLLDEESLDLYYTESNAFGDVNADAWFNEAISTLSNAEILNGYKDGSFKPNGYITRAEFAAITSRLYCVEYTGGDLFGDINGHWAAEYINQAAATGLVNGYDGGKFMPDKKITRAEAITMINRALGRSPSEYDFEAVEDSDELVTFPDCQRESWYYINIREATNSHEFEVSKTDETEKWITLLEDELMRESEVVEYVE